MATLAALVQLPARSQSDGTLHPTFGFRDLTTVFSDLAGGGGNADFARDVAIQPDGKILLVASNLHQAAASGAVAIDSGQFRRPPDAAYGDRLLVV